MNIAIAHLSDVHHQDLVGDALAMIQTVSATLMSSRSSKGSLAAEASFSATVAG
jgi:predicted site-specific integrase-resolvase